MPSGKRLHYQLLAIDERIIGGEDSSWHSFNPDDKRLTYPIFQGEYFEQAQNVLDDLEKIANSINVSISQLVIAWTIQQSFIASTLCGAKRDWQIQETAQSMQINLDTDLLAKMDRISEKFARETAGLSS